MKIKVQSANDLLNMSATELRQQANILLYGAKDILEEAEVREVFSSVIYIPRHLNKPLIYKLPKLVRADFACEYCGQPRSAFSASMCRRCYRTKSRLKYFEKRDGHSWVTEQINGVVMPETEWWDDSDIPATPKKIASVLWDFDKLKR